MSEQTVDQALEKLQEVSDRLHEVAKHTSGDFRIGMHRQAIEYDDAMRTLIIALAVPSDITAIAAVSSQLEQAKRLLRMSKKYVPSELIYKIRNFIRDTTPY